MTPNTGGTQIERLVRVETVVKLVKDDVKDIRDNDLPHLRSAVDNLDNRMQRWIGGGFVLLFVVQAIFIPILIYYFTRR